MRKGMVVALGALHLHAQKDARRAGGDLLGLLLIGLKERGRTRHETALPAVHVRLRRRFDRRRQQFAQQRVVGLVGREPQSQPGLKLRGLNLGLDVLGRAGQHQPAPGVGEVLRMRTAAQQVIDHAAPLVGGRVGQKGLQLGDRRDLANHI